MTSVNTSPNHGVISIDNRPPSFCTQLYHSTKTWGHEVGLSCAFRQWRANHSHCSYLHGYAISVRVEFAASHLDERNWVVDFGGLKTFKQFLVDTFDHKTLVAKDDPMLPQLRELSVGVSPTPILDIVEVDKVGCEAFSELIFSKLEEWLLTNGFTPRVWVTKVEVAEHGGNSAYFTKENVRIN